MLLLYKVDKMLVWRHFELATFFQVYFFYRITFRSELCNDRDGNTRITDTVTVKIQINIISRSKVLEDLLDTWNFTSCNFELQNIRTYIFELILRPNIYNETYQLATVIEDDLHCNYVGLRYLQDCTLTC
jgi:hypothetical protein